jgi:replicative DNA helicase
MDNFINNVELEYKIISTLLNTSNSIYNVNTLLNDDCFTDALSKKCWIAINELHNQGKPTDLAAVYSYLHDRDKTFSVSLKILYC